MLTFEFNNPYNKKFIFKGRLWGSVFSKNITLGIIALVAFATTVVAVSTLQTYQQPQSANAASFIDPTMDNRKAPTVVTDDNAYIAWWSNKTGNDEVMFRASNDGGLTFGDKINLSNTTTSESVDAMIDADGDTVVVTWWERNQTANEPTLRISTDAGETFGPILNLAANETIENE